MTISFVGTIYEWHPLNSFLEICNSLVSNENNFKIKIKFYGSNNSKKIVEHIEQKYQKLKNYVCFYPKMDNYNLMKELRKSNLLLLFNYYSFMGTKIYDYLAAKRLIIFCFQNDKITLDLKEDFSIAMT